VLACIHTITHTHTQTNKLTHTQTCTRKYAYKHTHTNAHAHTHARTHTHAHTNARTHARTHTHLSVEQSDRKLHACANINTDTDTDTLKTDTYTNALIRTHLVEENSGRLRIHKHVNTHTHVSPYCRRESWKPCVRTPTQQHTYLVVEVIM